MTTEANKIGNNLVRNARGQFVKGHPKTSNGRPPAEFSITELLRAEIASRPNIVKRWCDLMESDDERVALMAMTTAANRIDGNPKQAVELDDKREPPAVEAIRTFQEGLRRVK